MEPFFSKKMNNFGAFRNNVIRHKKMAIYHMWQVANGLDNTALDCEGSSK